MELRLFKTLWGHEGTHAQAAALAVEAGFHGLEGAMPVDPGARRELARVLADHGLAWIGEITTAPREDLWWIPRRDASVEEHLESVRVALDAHDLVEPLFLNCMGGLDAWSVEQSVELFGRAMELARERGRLISFETHRTRSTFSPWSTRAIVEQLPDIAITCDFSHWCVVCERMIDTEEDVLELVIPRAQHVQPRVGYAQGPQVPHPADPRYAAELAAHQRWWERIWEAQQERGFRTTTMTPEFGPDGYLHRSPFCDTPVADLWELNTWIARAEVAHFERFRAAHPEQPDA